MQRNPTKLHFMLITAVLLLLLPSLSVSSSPTQDPKDRYEGYQRSTEFIELEFGLPYLEYGEFGVEVRMEGAEMDPRSSHLRLPMLAHRLDLPLGSVIEGIKVENSRSMQIPIPTNIGNNPHSISKQMGATPIVPDGGRIEQADHISYELMTGIDEATMVSEAILSIIFSPVTMEDGYLECIVDGALRIDIKTPAKTRETVQGIYDVLVICPESFTDVASDYSEFRNATGKDTIVVTMEEVQDGTYWNIRENDTQEDIKRFIYNARMEWGIDYVLLAGDQEHIPCRHIYVPDGYDDNGAQYTDGSYVPSDLYYSDLFEGGTTTFSTWNEDRVGNSVYLWGEWDGSAADDPDLYPDVYVGRLPASSIEEFEDMVYKIKMYELNAKGSEWFYNATLCGTNTFTYNPTPEGEYTCDYIESRYLGDFNVTKLYETTSTLFNISNVFDQGTGLIVFSDHGDYDGWGYTSSYPSGAYTDYLADRQENGHMLPVVILDACLTSGFDNENASDMATGKDPVLDQWYYPPGIGRTARDSLAEILIINPDGGAIATYGCTRVGYGSPGTTYPTVNSGYMDVRLNKAITEGDKTTGEVLATAISDYLTNIGITGSASYKTVTEYVLLGDPSLNIGGITGTNVRMDLGENITVTPGENVTVDFSVENIGIIPAQIMLNATIIGNGRYVWSVNISQENATILPGAFLNGTIDVYAPPTALATQTREVVLKVDSALFSSARSTSITAFTLRTQGVEIVMDPLELEAAQGSDAVGFIDVQNLGNGDETFDLSFPDLMDGWIVNMTSFSVDVDAYKTAGYPFKITVPERYLAGTYGITVSAVSRITGANTTTVLNMTVKDDSSFLLEIPSSKIELYPEENISVPFNLVGSTNLPVTIEIDWDSNRIEDWSIGMANRFITLEPFSDGSGEIWIEAPNGTDPGVYTLEIMADNGFVQKEVFLDIVILKKYAYDAVCENTTIVIDPGDDLTFTINVSNLGNIYDQFNTTVLGIVDENWTATMNPDLFSVAKDSKKEIYLDIKTVFPLNGTYIMSVLIEPWSGAGPRTIPLRVIVRKSFDFDLAGGFIEDRVAPGGSFVGNFQLNNEGNSEDSFSFNSSVEAGWTIQTSQRSIVIGPASSADLDVSMSVPSDALAGEYTFQFQVTNNGSGETRTFTRTIFVKEVFDLRMTIGLENNEMELRPGRIYQFTVLIENFGNAPDTVKIGIAASSYVSEWISLSTSTFISVQAGENKTLEVTIDVPENITEGEYRLSLIVGSMGDIEAVKTNLTLHVKENKGNGVLSRVDMVPIIIAAIAGLGIIILVVFMLVRSYKKSSGMDIEDAGMEWEEEDDEDKEVSDWDDDWE